MQVAVFCALGLLLFTFWVVWLIGHIRYRITPRHFQVVLFGLRLRQIGLQDIESVSKRHANGWAERWYNTLHPSHRRLVIRRKRGLRRFLVITPRNRYVFKADLERAMEQLNQPAATDERLTIVTD